MGEEYGTKVLQSFSPSWTRADILERTLVGRKDLVDRLEELVIDGAGGCNQHQRLIVGVRGSGKTHVLRVLHNRLWRNEELKNKLLIIYLLEDELGVASFLDFVVRLLRAIVRWYPEHKNLPDELNHLYDLPLESQEHHAVQLLLKQAEEKDVLILLENLGITFDDKGFGHKGQQAFRNLIQNHPRFMIMATSQALVRSIKDPQAPFYEFFKVIHLKKLKVEEAIQFVQILAEVSKNKDIIHFLNSTRGRARIRAIFEYTGGNHRLLVSFFEFLTSDSLSQLSEQFIQALNPLKPYYQEQMRSLTAQQQKIIQFLALSRHPCTVKNIARGCFTTSNTVSSQLKDLFDKHFVNKIDQGRETYYEITEPLFRICYEADLEQQGAPVRLFVDFLANLYTAEELHVRQRRFDVLASTIESSKQSYAIESQYDAMALECCKLDSNLTNQEISAHINVDNMVNSPTFFKEIESKKEANGTFEKTLALSTNNSEKSNLFISRGELYRLKGHYESAIEDYKKAIELNPENVLSYFNMVSALVALNRIHEGLEFLQKALVTDKNIQFQDRYLIVQSIYEFCLELFEHTQTRLFLAFLEPALEELEKEDFLKSFEESLPITVFKLIKKHETIGEDRYLQIIKVFDSIIANKIPTEIYKRFLQVGIDYFKKQERKALFRLTKEERKTFCEKLEIIFP